MNEPNEAELKLAREIVDRLEIEHFESDAANTIAALLAARRDEGELARLRKIETAAKTMLAAWYEDDCKAPEILELRAALAQREKA